jgi:hypothetical protein
VIKRLFFIILAVSLLGAVPAATAAAPDRGGETKLRTVVLDGRTNCNRFCQGEIRDWSTGKTQVLVDFRVDTLDGSTESAPEWGVEVYNTPCGSRRGYPTYTGQAIDHPQYGVRINEFFEPHLLAQVPGGSVVVVHDGPTPTQHAIDEGFSGRHELACIDIVY